ncbi:phosphatidylinositol N-acetylglucosaminyltransferase subunit H-like [Argonauta hians]
MLRHEVRFTHKDYGKHGSEFIIEHPQIHIFRMLYSTPILTFVAYLVNLSEWDESSLYIFFIILLAVFVFKLSRKVLTESVLFLTAIGVQIETKFLFGHCTTKFIDMTHIKDIVILEGVRMHHIIFYLALLLQKPDKVWNGILPLFTHSWPRLCILETLCKTVHSKFPNLGR